MRLNKKAANFGEKSHINAVVIFTTVFITHGGDRIPQVDGVQHHADDAKDRSHYVHKNSEAHLRGNISSLVAVRLQVLVYHLRFHSQSNEK